MRYLAICLIPLLAGCLLLDPREEVIVNPDGTTETVVHPSPLSEAVGSAAPSLVRGDWVGALVGGVTTLIVSLIAAKKANEAKRNLTTLSKVVKGVDAFRATAPVDSPVTAVLLDSLRASGMTEADKSHVKEVRNANAS